MSTRRGRCPDLRDGLSQSWIWTALSMQDIKLLYRGSILDPFWLTISTLVMIVAIGAIYACLFQMETSSHLPFLMIGLIVWQFISSVVNDACQTFLAVQASFSRYRCRSRPMSTGTS